MITYSEINGDRIKLETHDSSFSTTNISEFRVTSDQPGDSTVCGTVVPDSPQIEFDDIFKDNKQFDVHITSNDGSKKVYCSCMAISASPKRLELKCSSVE